MITSCHNAFDRGISCAKLEVIEPRDINGQNSRLFCPYRGSCLPEVISS
jgi:hypothetical protein